jgi:hypothetical protein
MAMSAGSEGGSSPEFVSELFFDEEGEKKRRVEGEAVDDVKRFHSVHFSACSMSGLVTPKSTPHCLLSFWLVGLLIRLSSPKDPAGDDETCSHRQRVRPEKPQKRQVIMK